MKDHLPDRFLILIKFFLVAVLTGFSFLFFTASAKSENAAAPVPVYGYKVVNTYPHDPQAFTQGLFFKDGLLFEGTGLNGQSTLRKIKLGTGDVLKSYRLPQEFFGEGITAYNNRIIQLTWKSHIGFVYDKDSFKILKTFYYPTEGWGITHDGKHLIMSDGTANLYFLDPETFKETSRIEVRDGNMLVTRLNELEYVLDEIYANVWLTDRIAKINPRTGKITGWINLKGLSPIKNSDSKMKALNGIAYDAENGRLFVTGKLWPNLYEIRLVPAK